MKQVRILWSLLFFYGFAVAELSHKVAGKLDREFNQGFTHGMNNGPDPFLYLQGSTIIIALLGGLLTVAQLRRLHRASSF